MKIGRLSIVVEIDDKPCVVLIHKDRVSLALHLISSLSDNGKLNVFPAPDNYKFEAIGAKK